ncbi:N-methylhydantoinase B [Thiolapillus brandeum]|uniref:N-methylhydantoinase B n=2 Tax=Thiolapillus brandeum TaxID=1076588 RepID=A0A7U6GHB8_9GAMM|nr:N-methylhydantoinase B [Thiolapillus brandeum]
MPTAIDNFPDALTLSLFASRVDAICDDMGVVLRNTAFSPNIRDRLDYSCAIFDAHGELCAQAAHIPVHLGSMAFAMGDIVSRLEWREHDQVILNDPFLGGTHLPDVTLIAPVFVAGDLEGFVVNRAHHADIGADTPGSMPVSSRLDEEGLVIEPVHLVRQGQRVEDVWERILDATRNPRTAEGDISAQLSANRTGIARLQAFIAEQGREGYRQGVRALNDYGQRMARSALEKIPQGEYYFEDFLDDDGQGQADLLLKVCIRVDRQGVHVDFTGTAEQVKGNVNCPLSVAAAGVYYVFRCIMPPQTPACAGVFRDISLHAPEGCLLNACYPSAVAAGNVETSTRVVDLVMGALAQALPEEIPAASHGSMNNLAMGSARAGETWDYYETMGGGMGAGPRGGGLSAVQTHMTNTLNTPVEVLEQQYPLRLRQYAIRRGSGGPGRRRGGDGLIREFEFLGDAEISLLTERRHHRPWGLAGGKSGAPGINRLNNAILPAKCHRHVRAGDVLCIETPGGGGWGETEEMVTPLNDGSTG